MPLFVMHCSSGLDRPLDVGSGTSSCHLPLAVGDLSVGAVAAPPACATFVKSLAAVTRHQSVRRRLKQVPTAGQRAERCRTRPKPKND